MQPASTAFKTAVLTSPQRVRSKLEVWTAPTATSQPQFIQALEMVDSVGANVVTDDETQVIRRNGQFSIIDRNGTLIPETNSALLHPDTGNELRPYRGLVLPDGTIEYVPMGVFGISEPKWHYDSTQGALVISIQGYDRMLAIKLNEWTDPYTVTQSTVAAAVEAIGTNRFPGIQTNVYDNGYAQTNQILGANSTGNDPSEDMTRLAGAGGEECFFDGEGILVVRPIPDPTTLAANFSWGSAAGFTVQEQVLDETQQSTQVIVIGEGSNVGTPIIGKAKVKWTPIYQKTYYITSSTVTTQAQADAVAAAWLLRLQSPIQELSGSLIADPQANSGDIAAPNWPRVGVDGSYVISQVQTDLSAGGLQAVQLRPTEVQKYTY